MAPATGDGVEEEEEMEEGKDAQFKKSDTVQPDPVWLTTIITISSLSRSSLCSRYRCRNSSRSHALPSRLHSCSLTLALPLALALSLWLFLTVSVKIPVDPLLDFVLREFRRSSEIFRRSSFFEDQKDVAMLPRSGRWT